MLLVGKREEIPARSLRKSKSVDLRPVALPKLTFFPGVLSKYPYSYNITKSMVNSLDLYARTLECVPQFSLYHYQQLYYTDFIYHL